MKIIKDGNMYTVMAGNFVNLQESKDYFFISEEEYKQFIDPIKQVKFIAKAFLGELSFPQVTEEAIKEIEDNL